MDYLYDGTFEGLMTCIYHHYKKEKAAGIYMFANYQQSVVQTYCMVKTDVSKAKVVIDAINKLISNEAYIYVYYCCSFSFCPSCSLCHYLRLTAEYLRRCRSLFL